MSATRPKPHTVYVASDPAGPHKIGVSYDPASRILMSDVRSGRAPLRLIATYSREATGDAFLVERIAHRFLAENCIDGDWRDKRVGSEWFNVTGEQAIATVRKVIEMIDSGEWVDDGANSRRRLELHPTVELWDALDRWRIEQPGVPARAVAARMLLEETLMAKGAFEPTKPATKRKGPAKS